ncbi:MAG: Fatty acid hydroxylase family (carotene hydroxylase/sterol desaturase) [Burkholderiaceae bacterium]|jgi:sterol desaturase/sphingolipid hydroxylase (fatty acid hydroxylase superfamily)|nr:MAG: Fatty acid hydroxylase family (carotene hydroxylase/sterol desaturase) [Burkholderiaceae bacterium]
MEAVDLIGLLVPATYLVMLAIESRWPARAFPPRKGWRWLGIGFLLMVGIAGATVPLVLPLDWMAAHRWMDGTRLGVAGGALAGWLVQSFVTFVSHRAYHAFSPLWRLGHQMHHSPQRVDISGSVLFHPTEVVLQVLFQLFVTVIVLGLDPLAAALVGYVAAFHGMFQHWNVRTPRWLGYFIQRPESHCVHHRRGMHSWNYSDLPLWDMLFGSFRNPREFRGECGFDAPADRRVGALLAWHDVNAARYGAANRGAAPPSGPAIA